MKKSITLQYWTGESVELGDRLFYPGFGYGDIVETPEPGSCSACAWSIPEGGIVIRFDSGTILTTSEMDEDFELISKMC